MNLYFVTGGAGCGKSAYAETLCERKARAFGGRKIYLATMANDGSPETEAKISRHRQLRAGKGFVTIERQNRIGQAAGEIRPGDCVLLEDLGNLTAGEMFGGQESGFAELPEEKKAEVLKKKKSEILAGLCALAEAAGESGSLIIVSNEVGLDGCAYDPLTMQYIRLLSALNRELAARSALAVRLVAGIPVILKGKEC